MFKGVCDGDDDDVGDEERRGFRKASISSLPVF
jgi:hypothetical protein